jgi:bifunctional non-homologous end joining protein LigD
VAKRIGSPYLPGRRTDAWRKIKVRNTQDCVILGYTPGQDRRSDSFGALLVGAWDDGALRWVGQVGTGFTDAMLAQVLGELEPLRRDEPATDEIRAVKGAVFVTPSIVCEVEYLEITKGQGKMRAPSFKGLRPDVAPEDCILERPAR